MKMFRFFRQLILLPVYLIIIFLICSLPVFAQETEDSQLFLTGFNAYQQKDYTAAVNQLSEVLKKFPDTPLRDMTLFWLARSYYNSGNRQDAASYMAQFIHEYPDNPLKNTVEEDLLVIAAQYKKSIPADKPDLIIAKAEADRQAKVKVEAERIAAEKAEANRAALAKAESERLAKVRAEEERAALAKAEAERIASAKAEADRQAKAKVEAERIAAEKAEANRTAMAKAESERLAKVRAEEERASLAKAEAGRIASEKAEADRQAKAKIEAERIAAEKAEANRAAMAKVESDRLAKIKSARETAERLKSGRTALKDKAIAEYKRIIERFPGTQAARTAVARLKELGVAVVMPVASSSSSTASESVGTSQVLALEVAQYAAFEFDTHPPKSPLQVTVKTAVSFEIQNRGNGKDSFYLESGFPAEFGVRFSAAGSEQLINQTPLLAPGESFKGQILLTVPPVSIDGLRIAYPVKAASQFMPEASQSRVIPLVASAPLLRAVAKTDKSRLLPGETVQYRIALLNVGSTTAQDVTLRLNYPAQYRPLEFKASGFRQEMNAALVLDGLTLKSGESRDITVVFRLEDEALSGQELMLRADVVNNSLKTRGTFLSNATSVLPVTAIELRTGHSIVTAIPGQTVSLPARVVNKGNQREQIRLAAISPSQKIVIYHDLNRDGLRQPGEPEITAIGPLGPKEEAALLLEISTSKSARDGAVERISLIAAPESARDRSVSAEAQINYSRPVLQFAMKGRQGSMVPGELLTVEMDVMNKGSNLAKMVELEITWPEQVELVAADQKADKSLAGSSIWRFNELGAGEKRIVKASFRIKPGIGVGTGVQLKSLLTYQDHAGNRY